jgi:putative oxidoreductase
MSFVSSGRRVFHRLNGNVGWDLCSLPLRLMVAFAFIFHGFTKFTPGGHAAFVMMLNKMGIAGSSPLSRVVPSLEILGGVMVLLGIAYWLFIPILFAILLVALVTHLLLHSGFSVLQIKMTPNGPVYGFPGTEIDFFYMAGLLTLFLGGAGRYSLSRLCANHRYAMRSTPRFPTPVRS